MRGRALSPASLRARQQQTTLAGGGGGEIERVARQTNAPSTAQRLERASATASPVRAHFGGSVASRAASSNANNRPCDSSVLEASRLDSVNRFF